MTLNQNQPQKIDIGLAVRKKMDEHGTTVAWLAMKINCDESNLRKHLHKEHIYPELLIKISISLKTDFFIYYSQYVLQSIENK